MNDQPKTTDIQTVYSEACRLVDGLLFYDVAAPTLDDLGRQRLERAVLLFSTVVHFNPTHWVALWLLGKVALRLGKPEQAFNYFRLASNCNPNHPDVLRETTIASLDLGRLQDAVIYGSRAVEIHPDDAGLNTNLALALLFSERLDEAKNVLENAQVLAPTDKTIQRLCAIVAEVHAGARPCPHHVRDLN